MWYRCLFLSTSFIFNMFVNGEFFCSSFSNNKFPNYNKYSSDNFYEKMFDYSLRVQQQNAAHQERALMLRANKNYYDIIQNMLSSATHFSILYQAAKIIFKKSPSKPQGNRLLLTSIFDIIQFSGHRLRNKNDEGKY